VNYYERTRSSFFNCLIRALGIKIDDIPVSASSYTTYYKSKMEVCSMKISFILNNKAVTVTTDPMKRLLDVLREDFGFTGTKEGCGEGECGACTILLEGRSVLSCLIAVGSVEGKNIETIESLSEKNNPHYNIIEAFQGSACHVVFAYPFLSFRLLITTIIRVKLFSLMKRC
jgi:hypothetical protein